MMNVTYRTPTLEEMGEMGEFKYESPIEAIFDHIEESFEENVYKAVQSYGINVDKEELEQALNYDRHQYEKGYSDGKRAGLERRVGAWEWDDDNKAYMCSQCKNHAYGETLNCMDGTYLYCPFCGAIMRGIYGDLCQGNGDAGKMRGMPDVGG